MHEQHFILCIQIIKNQLNFIFILLLFSIFIILMSQIVIFEQNYTNLT
jgi:hypothetical protein